MNKRTHKPLVVFLLVAVIVSACATTEPVVREKLDLMTGVTVTFSGTPLILFRDDSGRAAFARSYLHLGPIQVNRGGTYQYYLWLGAWHSMQLVDAGEHQQGLESVVLFADGEPMALDLAGWTPEAIGTSEPVYLKPSTASIDAYYRVTADQIRMIAHSTDLRLQTSGMYAREFVPWDNQLLARSELLEFLDRAFF